MSMPGPRANSEESAVAPDRRSCTPCGSAHAPAPMAITTNQLIVRMIPPGVVARSRTDVPSGYGAAVAPGGKSICSEVRETRSHLRNSRARMSGGHPEQGGELLPPAAAQLEAGAVVHDQHELAVEIGLELPNAGDVHDGRPVYPEELPWVESGLELAHG